MTMCIPPVATGGDSPTPWALMAVTLEWASIVVKPRSHDRSTRSPWNMTLLRLFIMNQGEIGGLSSERYNFHEYTKFTPSSF
jgi:hypothetical protein